MEHLGRVRLGIFRNKNVFRNIFRLFCSQEQNSQNGIQVFRNENSSQTNAYLHYSNYSYSRLIPNERALSLFSESLKAMLHKAIFLATCNAINVALQVARKNSRVTPQFATAIAALRAARKVEGPSTFRNLARQVACV